MSESGFRISNEAFSVGAELSYTISLTAFFHPFLTAQGKKWRKLLIIFSVYLLCELVCNQEALPQGYFGLIMTMVMLAVSKRIDLERPFVFLLMLLYFNARISSGLMVASLYFIVERLMPFHT